MSAETKVVIKYETIIQTIGNQFRSVWNALMNSADYKDEIKFVKNIEISDEQNFITKRDKGMIEPGTIYIVVKFGIGSINYGSSVAPITLMCLGTANLVKPSQLLFGVFASSWTTKYLGEGLTDSEDNMLQVWNTPEVVTNFNEVKAEFRNLFRLSGNIVIGTQAVRVGKLSYYWDKTGVSGPEIVNIMTFQDGYRASLDSQPFGNTNGFAKSEVNFSTYTFSISTYLLDNHLTADILAIRGYRNRSGSGITSTLDPNEEMTIKIELSNGFDNFANASDFFANFKVVDSTISQEIAGIPTLTITFTR